MAKRVKVSDMTGVYTSELSTGDVAYYITYKKGTKKIWEKVGTASNGFSAKDAFMLRETRLSSTHGGGSTKPSYRKLITLDEVWLRFKESLINPNTLSAWTSSYKNHIKPFIGDKYLDEITIQDLEKIVNKMRSAGLSPTTAKFVLKIPRRLFNKAIDWDLFEGKNPASHVYNDLLGSYSDSDNWRTRTLTEAELDMLLTSLKETSHPYRDVVHDYVLFAVYTGLRANELFNIKNQDIDIENRQVFIRRGEDAGDSGEWVKKKVGKGRRIKLLPKALEAALRHYDKDRPGWPLFRYFRHKEDGIACVSRLYAQTADRLFNEGKGPLDRVVFHTLRHTFATWLVSKGVPLHTVSKLMGHSTTKMTERYAKSTEEAQDAAIDVLVA